MKRYAFALALLPVSAFGQTIQECAQASEDAQLLRIHTKLGAAREKLVFCSQSACPKIVRRDCSTWLDEVDRAMPTVVIGAQDATGKDLVDVRVSLDGIPIATRLDGKPLPVDPGSHTLRFELAGQPARDEPFVAREGEKDRLVSVRYLDVGAPPPPPPPPPDHAFESRPRSRAPSAATWIVGGLGLATLAAAGIIGTLSLVQRQNLYDSCGKAGTCNPSDVDQVYLMYDLSYGGAAIGGALLLTGVVLFFTTRPSAATTRSAQVTLTPAGLAVYGRF